MPETIDSHTSTQRSVHPEQTVREAVEPRRLKTEEMLLNIGPQHPSTHGVLRLEVVLDGEIVLDVRPHVGYLHRCFEKHAESMTYPQVVPYTDRTDYVASMCSSYSYVAAVERMMGIQVPEKVEFIRVLFLELQRIASHMVAIGTYGLDVGAFTPFLYCFRLREAILHMFEITCGARFLYNYMWVGGLSHEMHPDVPKLCREFLKDSRRTHKEISDLLTFNKIFIERTASIGVLPADLAIAGGASGPMLRGSGVKWDLRRDDPYSIYDRFDFEIPVGTGMVGTVGDTWDRHWIRVREWEESMNIIEQVLAAFPYDDTTDVHAAIPKRVKPPTGEIYSRTETPRGEQGYYVVSRDGINPWRVKQRSPAFCNLSLLPHISRGYLVSDLVAIVGSLDIVLGEVDR